MGDGENKNSSAIEKKRTSAASPDSNGGIQMIEPVHPLSNSEGANLSIDSHGSVDSTQDLFGDTTLSEPLLAPVALHDLTLEELRQSLCEIGHNPHGELVYTRSNLASKYLSALPGLQVYVHLQRLYVDDNGLTELDAVRYMPQLVHLHARRNRLTSDVLGSLSVAAAGCLEKLYLDDNCITSLQGLEKLPFLVEFTCSKNRVQHLPASCLSAAHRLLHLSLSENVLETIDTDAFAVAGFLRLLELDKNLLSSTDFLSSVPPQIEKVNISHNRVRHLSSAFQHLASIIFLDLGENQLSGLDEVRVLRSLEALRTLIFTGNPSLQYLPQHMSSEDDRLQSPSTAKVAFHRTEYHAEVVMSDEDDERGLTSSGYGGGDTVDAASIGSTTTANTDVASTGNAFSEDYSPHEAGSFSCPSVAITGERSVFTSDRGGSSCVRTKSTRKGISCGSSANQRAAATTAAYARLASPETHGYVRAVGSVRRDPKLDVRVRYHEEIFALPASEQVYLWTLSVLPQVTELNGHTVCPEDVAKAAFLFHANVAEGGAGDSLSAAWRQDPLGV